VHETDFVALPQPPTRRAAVIATGAHRRFTGATYTTRAAGAERGPDGRVAQLDADAAAPLYSVSAAGLSSSSRMYASSRAASAP
jgi:hypothetical protein